MRRMFFTGTISILILCQFSCNLTRVDKKYHGVLKCKELISLPASVKTKTDTYFGFQYTNSIFGNYLVSYFEQKLYFHNISDTMQSFVIDFSDKFIGYSKFLITKINDNNLFYVLDGNKNTIATYFIDYIKKNATFRSLYEIPLKLNPGLEDGKSIRFQIQNTFEIIKSNLFISYCANNASEENYFGTKAYLEFNLGKSFGVNIPDFPVPQRFKDWKNNFATFFLKPYNDSLLLYGFSAYDSLYLYNLNSNSIIKRTKFSTVSAYKDFDRSKVTDLAYTRKFEITDEKNVTILINKTINRILIIKRIAKKNSKEKNEYEYYLLDSNLKILTFNKFNQKINPYISMPFKNGFLISDSLKMNGYYYE